MKKEILILLSLLFAFYTEGVAQQLRADLTPVIQHHKGEILFQLNNKTALKSVVGDIFKEASEITQVTTVAGDIHIYKVSFDPAVFNEKDILNQFKFHKEVKAAQFNHLVQERKVPNDPQYNQEWSLSRIEAPSVWDITTGGVTACGDTIVVAVLDQGFDINHPDLKANIWHNRLEIPNNNKDDDGNGLVDDYNGWNFNSNSDTHVSAIHGTNCLGVIGAKGDNNIGITGINWNVKLMILSGIIDDEKIINAYAYAIKMRQKYTQTNGVQGAYVTVSSMSLGFRGAQPSDFPLLCDVYTALNNAGILNVVAADNVDGDIEKLGDVPGLCANEHLLVVNRTDKDGNLPKTAAYSTKYIDLSAPGESIMTTYPNGEYATAGGNSFAAPLVAGASALMASIPQDSICKLSRKSPLQAMVLLKNAILKGVEPLPSLNGKTATGGQLNVRNSLNFVSRLYGAPIGDYSILKIYPSPVNAQLFVSAQLPEKLDADIVVTNSIGQIVFQRKLVDKDLISNKISINTEGLAAGVYYVSLLSNDYKSTKKFVVVH